MRYNLFLRNSENLQRTIQGKKANDTLTPHFLLLSFDTPTWHVLFRITMKEKTQLFWNTCVSGVESLNGQLSSNKWFAVCNFGTHTCVSGVVGQSGQLSSLKWFAVCSFGTHTCVSGVEGLSGQLSSNKWFAVCSFTIHTCLRGENTKWLVQFK